MSRDIHWMAASSPCSSTLCLHALQMGAKGSSLSSQPAMTGISASSSDTRVTDKPGLCLAALSEQDYVLARQQRVLELRDHALVEAHYARKEFVRVLDLSYEVLANLLLDCLRSVAATTQLAYGPRLVGAIGHLNLLIYAGAQGRARFATGVMILRMDGVCQFQSPLSPGGRGLVPESPLPRAGEG